MPINHEAELVAQQRILVVVPSHDQSSGVRARFTYAARLSAEVFSFNVDCHTARFDIIREFVRNVVAQAFLAGEALRIEPGNSRKLGNPDQLFGGQIPDPRISTDRQNVVFA